MNSPLAADKLNIDNLAAPIIFENKEPEILPELGYSGTYKPFIIYGNENKDTLSISPATASGSLDSILPAESTTDFDSISKKSDDKTNANAGDSNDAFADDDKDDAVLPGIKYEKWWQITLQVSIPFVIAGMGTIGAGIVLARLETWKVFLEITELFILVPALMGLKGNLDMCLASRLSTQANMGNMKSARVVTHMVVGNIALVQVQATVAAFLVAWFAIGVGALINGRFVFANAMLLLASSMFTATVSCFVLDFVLVAVILIAHKVKLNPDNLATPLAASIGDLVALSVLGFISSTLFKLLDTHLWITFAILGVYAGLLPLWLLLSFFNRYTRAVLTSGWVPILSALFISGLGGLILNSAVQIFNGFVVFQPIINGIGGNLVSVQASKISTMLHQGSIFGIVPPYTRIMENPFRALFGDVPYSLTARILIIMSIPGAVLFIFIADLIHMGESTIGAPFVFSYLLASFTQLTILLYIAHVITHLMWKLKIDPDNATIPYLTSLGDLIGSVLLLGAFFFLRAIDHEYDAEIKDILGSKLINELYNWIMHGFIS